MAIREKRVGKQLSFTAIAVSFVVTGALLVGAEKNPRKFAADMAVNNHAGYGGSLRCEACHQSPGLLSLRSTMTCSTSKCHGELSPGVNREEAVAILSDDYAFKIKPNFDERANRHLDLHAAAAHMKCTDCHQEHSPYEAPLPPGWSPDEAAHEDGSIDKLAWVSIVSEEHLETKK